MQIIWIWIEAIATRYSYLKCWPLFCNNRPEALWCWLIRVPIFTTKLRQSHSISAKLWWCCMHGDDVQVIKLVISELEAYPCHVVRCCLISTSSSSVKWLLFNIMHRMHLFGCIPYIHFTWLSFIWACAIYHRQTSNKETTCVLFDRSVKLIFFSIFTKWMHYDYGTWLL